MVANIKSAVVGLLGFARETDFDENRRNLTNIRRISTAIVGGAFVPSESEPEKASEIERFYRSPSQRPSLSDVGRRAAGFGLVTQPP